MRSASRPSVVYDHKLRRAVHEGDEDLARRLGVHRSTAYSWRKRACPAIVSLDPLEQVRRDLERRVIALERLVANLRAVIRLLMVLLRVRGGEIRS